MIAAGIPRDLQDATMAAHAWTDTWSASLQLAQLPGNLVKRPLGSFNGFTWIRGLHRTSQPGWSFECPFAAHIQVFDSQGGRFSFRADRKSDSGRADCVFAYCLIGKDVAVIVLQREGQFARALDHGKSVALFDNLNISEIVIGVGPEVGGDSRAQALATPAALSNLLRRIRQSPPDLKRPF